MIERIAQPGYQPDLTRRMVQVVMLDQVREQLQNCFGVCTYKTLIAATAAAVEGLDLGSVWVADD